MNKKHFEAIAAIIANTEACDGNGFAESLAKVSTIAESLADYFATQNKLFDREKFLAACGI